MKNQINIKSVAIGIFLAMFVFNVWYGIQLVKVMKSNTVPTQIQSYIQGGIQAGFFPDGKTIGQKLKELSK